MSAPLERLARNWVEPWPNARHLLRTRDWLLMLEPRATPALRLAALTHDAERNFPGSPHQSADHPASDRLYRDAHQARSAEVVRAWLAEQGAEEGMCRAVTELVLVHEWGGWPEANLLQAADSISFLEVNADHAARWMRERGHSPERIAEQFEWMYSRIGIDRARDLADPFYEHAQTILEGLLEHSAEA